MCMRRVQEGNKHTHAFIHHTRASFKCPTCNRMFALHDEIKVHLRQSHDLNDDEIKRHLATGLVLTNPRVMVAKCFGYTPTSSLQDVEEEMEEEAVSWLYFVCWFDRRESRKM